MPEEQHDTLPPSDYDEKTLTEFSLEAFLDDEDEPPTCKTLRTLSG